MHDEDSSEIRSAMESVREASDLVFAALTEPYESLAGADPDAALGAPLRVVTYVNPVSVRAVAHQVESSGRNAWALRKVEDREAQIRELVEAYRRGRFSTTTAAEWIAMVRKFQEAVHGDVNTAQQAPRGWALQDLGGTNHRAETLGGSWLTPRDVAPQLGLDERTVRRRITDGQLGPWRKQGRRWVISREAFFRYWDQLAQDDEIPQPPGAREEGREAAGWLEHYRID